MKLDSVIHFSRLLLGTIWLAFQITILFHPQIPMIQRPLHLGLALGLFLLCKPMTGKRIGLALARCINATLLTGVLAILTYYLLNANRLTERMEGIDEILKLDIICGCILMGILLECVRRAIGWSLLGVILIFLVYGFIGTLIPAWNNLSWMPDLFRYQGFGLEEAVEIFTMTPNGILGVTTSTSLLFVFYFVFFGAVYSAVGGGQLFIDIGLRLAGRQKGGAAKAAIVSSSLMGSISGSAVANVATTGVFTIPLMRRVGYSAPAAAGIEAIASTGGQLMPPIMGVAAFVMAELLQIPYARIALAGVLPAFAFYLSLCLVVDFHARRTGIGVLNNEDHPDAALLPRLYLLFPPILLVGLLMTGKSAGLAAVIATAACVPICYVRRKTWLSLKKWFEVIGRGTGQAAEVAVPIAAIGIIIEVAIQSNLALKFSTNLMQMSGGSVLGVMSLIIVGCIIMGMGLPTVAAYIIGAILFVPALIDLGIPDLAAHFFVMYYCVLSMVTPPVALAAYTAAGLASTNSMVASMNAFRLSLVAFFIPFIFAFHPALLTQGSLGSMAWGGLVISIGILGWAMALEGYLTRKLVALERLIAAMLALGIFFTPGILSEFTKDNSSQATTAQNTLWSVGIVLMILLILWCMSRRSSSRNERQAV